MSNKVAIVTGASKGRGGGIATAFAAAGARVAVNYSSDREGAERVAQAITASGARRSRSGPTCLRPQMSRGYSKKWIPRSEDWTFWSTTPGCTAPGVWAIGEVAGSPQFTHISVDDFRVVHANLTGGNRVTTGRQVPYCLFTDPEFARIGMSETEAEAQETAYRLFKVPMETNLRAHTLSETRGFVKALLEADSDRILGFTAFGVGAGETLAAVQIAMIAGLPYTSLRDAVLTHPTVVEGLIPLFSSAASAHNVVKRRGAQISAA